MCSFCAQATDVPTRRQLRYILPESLYRITYVFVTPRNSRRGVVPGGGRGTGGRQFFLCWRGWLCFQDAQAVQRLQQVFLPACRLGMLGDADLAAAHDGRRAEGLVERQPIADDERRHLDHEVAAACLDAA